jgi:hypothetical protein
MALPQILHVRNIDTSIAERNYEGRVQNIHAEEKTTTKEIKTRFLESYVLFFDISYSRFRFELLWYENKG